MASLERAKIARTVFVVPHPDLAIEGTIAYDEALREQIEARLAAQ